MITIISGPRGSGKDLLARGLARQLGRSTKIYSNYKTINYSDINEQEIQPIDLLEDLEIHNYYPKNKIVYIYSDLNFKYSKVLKSILIKELLIQFFIKEKDRAHLYLIDQNTKARIIKVKNPETKKIEDCLSWSTEIYSNLIDATSYFLETIQCKPIKKFRRDKKAYKTSDFTIRFKAIDIQHLRQIRGVYNP